jgi:hypothetical protein
LQVIINPTDVFYVTFEQNRYRDNTAEVLNVGDVMFRLHEQQPLGRVVAVSQAPATEFMRLTDGTALNAVNEGRVRYIVTLEATGSITDRGFFVNGNDHIAVGSDLKIVSNRVYFTSAEVIAISTERPSH